ncbi:MAG: aldo/keto reductase [Candidatus Bathyarchaeota archaeon]|nr:aldo/keto reductase [Candidatus Bathyarchaeota archaeon]MDH5792752.1 aldo/keto reductase [Candidatus Bathyarchaeota archaeon]
MERRRLGRTGQMSSVLTLGGAAFWRVPQAEADRVIELALEHGVNHIDVAPTYGEAELRLKKWMEEHRDEFFLACKTRHRTRDEAAEQLRASLGRLGVEHFDLYQLHGLDKPEELETALGEGGAMEAILEAQEEGLVDHIGITSHVPPTAIEAIKRFDFDTVLFPLNFILKRHPAPENDYEPLLELAKERDMGTIAMKAFTRRPWPTEERRYETWYEPWDTQLEIDRALWFTLSQGVTTAASAGDVRLFGMMVDAAERYSELTPGEQEELVASASGLRPLFPR